MCPQFDVLYDDIACAKQLELYAGMSGLCPADARAWRGLARCYVASGKYAAAHRALRTGCAAAVACVR